MNFNGIRLEFMMARLPHAVIHLKFENAQLFLEIAQQKNIVAREWDSLLE